MEISSILNYSVKTIAADDTIHKALEIMNNMNFNGMPVVNSDDQLVGMVVKSDVYRFLIQQGHFDSYPIERVMSKSVITAEVNEDIGVVAKRLRESNIVAIPVLENAKVVGIISLENLVDYYLKNQS
ncbi:Mg/Co/Ni transporter MgtE [Candidatus Desulfosporosinus infrequens]|uniref:Mg/Co/Ni transporter MgtE n=1 Tax=Candidatus Desulfosporosinus infrequens TaxID=2043169 RepID=A0A2U3LGE4_9FIRM|nr:Mg/Co/Ni transporter MgtE [Candidatus Desulfosporosinus infrequens]